MTVEWLKMWGRVDLEDFPAMPFVFAARHSRILMMQKHSENINAVMRNTDEIIDFVFMENNFRMFQDHVLIKYIFFSAFYE